MAQQADRQVQPLTRASAYQCRPCLPYRLCARGRVQGAGMADIVTGMGLAQQEASARRASREGHHWNGHI